MKTLRNKRKLAAVTRESQQEHPRNAQSRKTSVRRINLEHITQVFEKIEGRVTKTLSQELSRTDSCSLGALSILEEFLLNPKIRTQSGTVHGAFRNTNVEKQGTNEDDSQSDPHPEAGIFRSQTTQNSGPEVGHDMVTSLQKESLCSHDMVTRVRKESLCGHDSHFRIKCVLRRTVPCLFRCLSRNCPYFLLIPQRCYVSEEKFLSLVKTELIFILLTK